jgi:hypothetical protein
MLEQPKPPVRKPPALSKKPAAKPAAAAKTVATKTPVAGGDEEDGSGLSKEEAIEKVQSYFSAETVDLFDDEKWQNRVLGYKGMQEQIVEKKADSVMIEAIARFMKAKMKDWKESNMNMIKETINTLKCIVENCDRVP